MVYRLEDYIDFEEGNTLQVTNKDGARDMRQYVKAVEFSTRRHYYSKSIVDENARKGCLRMSSLGKPAVLQLLQYPHILEELESLGYKAEENDPDERKSLMFHLGDIFESWYEFLLQRSGLEVIQPPEHMGRQWEFTFHKVKGHADIIAKLPGENVYFVIDCKASGSYAVRELVKDPWRSKPEYVTQISLYAHCFREFLFDDQPQREEPIIIPVIASLNCDERRVYYTYIDEELAISSVNRAAKLVEVLPTVECWADIKGKIAPPPGVPVLYRNKPIGDELTVPPSMKFCPCLDLFYTVEEGKVRTPTGYIKKYPKVGFVDESGNGITNYVDPETIILR